MAVEVEDAQICSPGEIEDGRLTSALPRGAGLVSGIVSAWGLNMATGFTGAACMLMGERVRGGNGVKRVVLVQFSKRGEGIVARNFEAIECERITVNVVTPGT